MTIVTGLFRFSQERRFEIITFQVLFFGMQFEFGFIVHKS